MPINSIKNINLKKLGKILTFQSDNVVKVGLKIKNGYLSSAPCFKPIKAFLLNGKSFKKVYDVNGKTFALLFDDKLYKVDGNALTLLLDEAFNEPPYLMHLKEGVYDKVLIFSSNKNFLYDGTEVRQVDIPYGTCAIVYSSRLFVSNLNFIYFSVRSSFTDFTPGFDKAGFVAIPEEFGKVLAMAELKGKLYVICQRKIYIISLFGDTEEYTVKEVKTPYLNILPQSVAVYNDKVVFVSENKIYTFDGERISTIKSLLSSDNVVPLADSGKLDNIYFIKVGVYGKDGYVLCKDFSNDTDYIVYGVKLLSQNSHIGIGLDERLVEFNQDEHSKIYSFYIENNNFDDEREKCLLSFRIYSDKNATITVKGDFGEKEFNVKVGVNQYFCNLKSYAFTFIFNAQESSIKIGELSVNYTVEN